MKDRDCIPAIREAAAWAKANGFPDNPVTRELRLASHFEHDGARIRNIHRTVDFLCDFIAGLIVTRGYRNVLEIGTLFGYSTLHMAEAVALNDGHVDAVDMRVAEHKWGTGETVRNIHLVAERFVRTAGYADRVTFHVGNSTATLPKLMLEGREFDLIFVDGAHDRHTVTLDFINGTNLLRQDGAIVFNDIGPATASKPSYYGGPNSILPALWSSNRFRFVPISENTLVALRLTGRKERL